MELGTHAYITLFQSVHAPKSSAFYPCFDAEYIQPQKPHGMRPAPYHGPLLPSTIAVADPGFSRGGGAPTPKIAIIFHIFAENCMKMKEFGPPGGARVPGGPPWIRQ